VGVPLFLAKGGQAQRIDCIFCKNRWNFSVQAGVYILENTLPPWGGRKYQPMSFGGKNMKRQREKGGKYERKRKQGERKRRKGGKNEKRGSKRVK
jgi:hypothetical protein